MSFVESATLRLIDRTSEPVAKINRTLDKLFATGKELNTLSINVRINARPIDDLLRKVNTLQLRTRSVSLNISGLSTAVAQMNQLVAMSQRLGSFRAPAAGPWGGGPGGSWFNNRRGFNPNASLVDRTQHRIVGSAETALGRGFESSGAARDYARVAFPNEPHVRATAERFAQEHARKFPSIAFGTIMNTWLETAANVKPSDLKKPDTIAGLNVVTRELLATGLMQQMLGAAPDKSVAGLFKLAKALNLRGDFTDNATGALDVKSVSASMETVRRAMAYAKTELPAESVFQAIKYARSSRGAMDQNQLFHLLVAASDIGGSSSGVGQQSFIDQVMGRATKEAQSVQSKWGLIKGGIDPSSPAGPKKFRWEATTDDALLWSNNRQWIFKHFMQNEGKSVLEQMCIDWRTAKTHEIAPKLRPGFSNRVALDHLLHTITQFQEAENAFQRGNAAAFAVDSVRGQAKSSVRTGAYGLQKSLESLFGELIEATSAISNPAINAARRFVQFATPSNDDQSVWGRAKALGGSILTIGAAGLAGYGVYRAMGHLTGASAMSAAAAQHAGAARMLMAAAARLGVAGSLGRGLGAAGAGLGAAAGKASWLGFPAAAAAGGLLGRLFGGGSLSQRFGKLGWVGKLFAGLGVFGAGASLLSGDLLGTGLGLVGALGPLFGPLGMGLSVAAIIAEMFRGSKANASGLKSTPEGIKAAMGSLPKSSQDRAKLLDQRAKDWRGKGVQVDWRKSVVDLMKLMGLDDNGLAARKKLYEQLNKGESYVGSMSQNIKLQRQIEAQADQLKGVQNAVKPAANLPDAPKINRPTGWDNLQDDLNWLFNNVKSLSNQFDAFAKWSYEAIKKKRDDAQKQREKDEDELERKYPQRPDESNFAYQQRLGRMRRDQQYPDGPPKGIESWSDLWERFQSLFGGAQPDVMKNWESLDEQLGKSMRDALGQTTAAFEQGGQQASSAIKQALIEGGAQAAGMITGALANAKISIDPGSGSKPNTGNQASTIA